MRSLKSTGKGACILPHGVLFRGNAEADIRRNLVRKGYIKGIIGLPANLFYGTGIPACIVVHRQGRTLSARKGIFMIDASDGLHEGRPQEPPARPGHPPDRGRLQQPARRSRSTRAWSPSRRSRRTTSTSTCRATSTARRPRTCRTSTATCRAASPIADIDALERYWARLPALRHTLFKDRRPGYLDLAVDKAAIKTTIYEHPEFAAFIAGMNAHFAAWRERRAPPR